MAGTTLLVIDTATSRPVLALRRAPGAPIEDGSATAPERGAAGLSTRLTELLARTGVAPRDLAAVGAGTGPGSFTGLRVGLATAKTIAWSLGVPLAGIPTTDALRRAAADALGVPGSSLAVLQAAGARDHYLALPGEAPRLVPPAADLATLTAGHPVLALDADPARLAGITGPAGRSPLEAGALATAGLAAALLALLEERLATAATAGSADALDDPAALVPAYVALPRGIGADPAAWTPELR
ncbi:MAG: tRNA (adenosine(37)-N6)-threonylcarbamoyltransferase complex dimerization subunit type 1 TsaB [Chloroflexota bacterium]